MRISTILVTLLVTMPLLFANPPASDYDIVRVEITPSQVTLYPGESVEFDFAAFNSQGKEIPAAFTWRYSGGKLRQDGVFTAGERPGKYTLQAEISTGIKALAHITIRNPQWQKSPKSSSLDKAQKLYLSPSKITLWPGETQKFRFWVVDDEGNHRTPGLTIQVRGGSINSEGVFTAGQTPGQYQLVATTPKGLKAQAQITILGQNPSSSQTNNNKPGKLAQLRIRPDRVRLKRGESCQFEVSARDKSGNPVAAELTWSYQGGELRSDGTYIARATPGQYHITLTSAQGTSATAIVGIVPRKEQNVVPYWILLDPKKVKLAPGQSTKIHYRIVDDWDHPVNLEHLLKWQCQAGKFDPLTGVFTAGERRGHFYLHCQLEGYDYIQNRIEVIIK